MALQDDGGAEEVKVPSHPFVVLQVTGSANVWGGVNAWGASWCSQEGCDAWAAPQPVLCKLQTTGLDQGSPRLCL